MNRKNIPLLMMLVAGAVTCIMNLIQQKSVLGQMASLLVVLVIFYFLGSMLCWTLDYFDKQNIPEEVDSETENDSEHEADTSEERVNKSE